MNRRNLFATLFGTGVALSAKPKQPDLLNFTKKSLSQEDKQEELGFEGKKQLIQRWLIDKCNLSNDVSKLVGIKFLIFREENYWRVQGFLYLTIFGLDVLIDKDTEIHNLPRIELKTSKDLSKNYGDDAINLLYYFLVNHEKTLIVVDKNYHFPFVNA